MREIKFRAWDKFDGMLYTNKDLVILPSVFNPLDFSYSHYGRITFYRDKKGYVQKNITGHSGELMQYTGLKDKNGKEIYEGDFVKYEADDFKQGKYTSITTVSWLDDDDRFEDAEYGFSEGVGFVIEWNENQKTEVIGNIYENPNLLQGDTP